MKLPFWLAVPVAMTLGFASSQPVRAEPSTLRLGMQPGLPHLPVIVMKNQKLVEACLSEVGMASTTVQWFALTGSSQSDALLSSTLDFTSGGVTELATLWSATHGKVKAVAAEDAVPNDLLTTNPNVKSLKDFTGADRIAVPAVKVSPQAIMLQIAAEKAFGDYKRLDPLTVTMRPADATVALLTGSTSVNSHFSVPPFQEQELADPKVHRVLSSYDIMGGPATVVVMTTTEAFHDANPKSIGVVRCAVTRAVKLINDDKTKAAKIYIEETHDTKNKPQDIAKILEDPRLIYSAEPRNIMKYVDLMYKVGQIKRRPDTWKDLFFPEGQQGGGS